MIKVLKMIKWNFVRISSFTIYWYNTMSSSGAVPWEQPENIKLFVWKEFSIFENFSLYAKPQVNTLIVSWTNHQD